MPEYSIVDQACNCGLLIYPRKDYNHCPQYAYDFSVQVEKDISISCRFMKAIKI